MAVRSAIPFSTIRKAVSGGAVSVEQLAVELGDIMQPMRMKISRAILNGLIVIERHHKTEEIRRRAGQSAPVADKWTWRTGALAKSYERFWKPGDLVGYYGSPTKYARMMEEGGTVRPKRAKMLAIPLKAAKYGVGGGLPPSKRDDLFMIRSRKGNLLLVKAAAAGITPMFVLKDQVKIDPRRTIERTEKKKMPEVEKLIADAAVEPFGGK